MNRKKQAEMTCSPTNMKRRQDLRDSINELKRLYEAGLTTYQIAELYDCKDCIIAKLLRENGQKMRKGGNSKGFTPWNKGKEYYAIKGENNPRWKGGITSLNQVVRHCIEYKNWRRSIYKRDDWTCQMCGKRGGNLEVDHFPHGFAEIMSLHDIKSYEDAQKCQKLWDIANGRTLCLPCHNTTKVGSNN